ncbi:MAG: hypothetical protein IPK59_15950 [Rhodospirillaceae bacterium]|nr:hypothetical protein [Rhodospirillaceae bacterium]
MAANDNACTDHTDSLLAEDASEIFIESLPFASQFAIWAARSWVTALKLDQPFEVVSGGTFRRLDLLPAQIALDGFFRTVASSATQLIDIRCMKCRYVSADEMIFHQALSGAQQGDSFAAYHALRNWLPPAAARIAFGSLKTLATQLAQADLRLASPTTVASSVDKPALMNERAMPSLALH